MWFQKHVFPTDEFGKCVVLTKLSCCPPWVRTAPFCVCSCFCLFLCLFLPCSLLARTLIFIKNFFQHCISEQNLHRAVHRQPGVRPKSLSRGSSHYIFAHKICQKCNIITICNCMSNENQVSNVFLNMFYEYWKSL